MVKSELFQIIEFYELEKATLEASIRAFLEEEEFEMAFFQSKGLKQIASRLDNLYYFLDRNFYTRKQLKVSKKNYEKWLSENGQEDQFMKQLAWQSEQLLNNLNQQKIQPSLDQQEFDDALFDAVEGRIKGFRFHLKKEANFWLDFRTLNENILVISLTPLNDIRESLFLGKHQQESLIGLGFREARRHDKEEHSRGSE